MTDRRRLSEHINTALLAQRSRILAAAAHRPPAELEALAAELDGWYGTAHERLTVELRVDAGRNGRPDTRSTRAHVWLTTAAGTAPLLDVLVRDLVDVNGRPIDARATARDLLAQLAPVPDDLSGLAY